MNRRSFIHRGALGTVAVSATGFSASAATATKKFKLRYAPHPRMFKAHAGDDILDQIRFAHDQGFTAWEDNGLPNLEPALQEKVGKTLERLGMKMGVFVAYGDFSAPTFAVRDDTKWKEILGRIKDSIDVAKRCGAQCFTVVPGTIDQLSVLDPESTKKRYSQGRLAEGYQTANVIELLRRCSAILEPHGLTMVLEPLNSRTNHGGLFLERSDQAFALCRAVDSPACKILFDIYHQQITEGNLIPNIEMCWSEIGYFQAGDNPGRKEPGTGEINYRNVFKYIHDRSKQEGADFVIGMEHGNSEKGKEGERKVIQAYRDADAFPV